MDASPRVRRAVPDDADRIGKIHVRAWQATYRGVMPDAYLDALRPADHAARWLRNLDQPRPGQVLLVAEADGVVAGFAALGPADGRAGEHEVGQLYAINLDPDHWRRGLGRHLLRTVMAELRDAGYVEAVLWVVPENERARGFYESEGWTDDGAEREDDVLGVTVTDRRYRIRL